MLSAEGDPSIDTDLSHIGERLQIVDAVGVLALAPSLVEAVVLIIALERTAAIELGEAAIRGGRDLPRTHETVGADDGQPLTVVADGR